MNSRLQQFFAFACFFFLSLSLSAQERVASYSENYGQSSYGLFYQRDPASIYPTSRIPVCWERGFYSDPNVAQKVAVAKEYVKKVIRNAYEEKTGLHFVGWRDCVTSAGTSGATTGEKKYNGGIRISVKDVWPNTAMGHEHAGESET